MRMLGREEDYRLTTKNLREYFEIAPDLGHLEPPISAYSVDNSFN
jgi:hypothetical protein